MSGPSARFLYYDQIALSTSGYTKEFDTPARKQRLQEKEGPFETEPTYAAVGFQEDGELGLVLWAEDDLQALMDSMHALASSARVVCFSPFNTDAIGSTYVGCRIHDAKVGVLQPGGELTCFDFGGKVEGKLELGIILHNLTAETTDWDTEASSQDNSASSANGGIAHLISTDGDLDGGDGITHEVIDSADDITFGTLVSFTQITAWPTSGQRVTVSGTVERYVACKGAHAGTPGGSETDTTFIGFDRL